VKIYEKFNNCSKDVLMSKSKKELVDYVLVMQKNLINFNNILDIQYENSKKMIEELEKEISELKEYKFMYDDLCK
jgi:uncharacterized protein YlaN (UPF0358 family)